MLKKIYGTIAASEGNGRRLNEVTGKNKRGDKLRRNGPKAQAAS
jgi:hypothetical protein